MEGQGTHFLLVQLQGPPLRPFPFFSFPAKCCCFGDGVSVQAATNGVHASFVIPTCTRGRMDGRWSGEEEEEENFSAVLFFFFFFFLVISHLIDQYTPLNEYSSLKMDQAKIIPFLSAFHRQNIDHCLREEVYVQLHDPKPASFCP